MTLSPLLKVKERIVGPSGICNLQNEWYGYVDEFKYTIGLAGLMGFGVGCCRPELLPDDMAAMPGCYDRWSPNYGNYIHVPSASIMCFLPAHHIDIQSPGNTNAPFYGSRVVISDAQQGNSVLARPFRDGGQSLAGVFVDKYQICNVRPDGSGLPNTTNGNPGDTMLTGGIGASRPLQWPCSTGGFPSPISGIELLTSKALNPGAVTPVLSAEGVFAACRSRGITFNPVPIWTYAQLAYLSLAHGQALLDTSGTPISGATSNAAWMDVAPYAPKGNNNGGSDFNKTTLAFGRTDLVGANVTAQGFAGGTRAFTGAARISTTPAVEHTAHNGQLSGVVDLNGNQNEAAPGLTCDGSQSGIRMFSDNVSWNIATSNSDSFRYGINFAVDTGDNGVYWTASSNSYLIPASGGTYHPNSSWSGQPTRRMMTECMIPRSAATSGTQTTTNIFGGDLIQRSITSGFFPGTGGSSNGSSTGYGGIFCLGFAYNLQNLITINSSNFGWAETGCRAQRLLAA